MQLPQGEDRVRYVQALFARIARRYDLLNRLMTFGRDRAWREEAIGRLHLQPGQRVLDVGSGTGDIALQILAEVRAAFVVAADLTPEMVAVGRKRPCADQVSWVIADARDLPFCSDTFNGVISAYLLRNLPDVDTALSEQLRVSAPGGRWVALDTTPPRRGLLLPFIRFHLRCVIPLLGRWIAGDSEAYTYLPDSTARFLSAEALAARVSQAGFQLEGFVRRMFGSKANHWGKKPSRPGAEPNALYYPHPA